MANTNPYKYFVVKNRFIFQSGQALIAANSQPYWQNQQQRQAEKKPVFIEVICEDWYKYYDWLTLSEELSSIR
jgi:hypothetical protein